MSLFDLSSVVTSLSGDTVEFFSQTPTVAADGTTSDAAASLGSFLSSVQPITGKDAQAELELIQSVAGVTVWTNADLEVGEPGGNDGATFTWEGDTYQIRNRAAWQNLGDFYEYKAGKVT